MFIYKITNNLNGKIYVGKTINVEKRWYKHKYLAQKGEDKRHLYNAMRRYGVDNFSIEIIEECDDSIVNEREKYWIKSLNSRNKKVGYNSTIGGDGGDTWALNSHKEETIKKIKAKTVGHTVSEDARKIISSKHKGKSISDTQRKQISNTLKRKYKNGEIEVNPPPWHDRTGEKHSLETRKLMSDNKKGKTYEQIYGHKYAREFKEYHKQAFLGENNPQYKDVDKHKFLSAIKSNLSNKELAKMFGVSVPTIIDKCKRYFNKTPSEVRKEIK